MKRKNFLRTKWGDICKGDILRMEEQVAPGEFETRLILVDGIYTRSIGYTEIWPGTISTGGGLNLSTLEQGTFCAKWQFLGTAQDKSWREFIRRAKAHHKNRDWLVKKLHARPKAKRISSWRQGGAK